MTKPVIITRSGLRRAGLVLGVIGLLLTVTGIPWQRELGRLGILGLIAMLAGIGLWAHFSPQGLRIRVGGRRLQHGTGALLSTLVLSSLIVIIYLFVQQAVITVDMTQGERFTLSDQTMAIIRAANRADRPIQITGFYRPDQLAQREIDDAYFRLYETASGGRIHRRYIDTTMQPGLASRYDNALAAGVQVFVAFENEDGTVDFPTTIPLSSSGTQERDLTEALARLLVSGSFTVYFERSLGTLDPLDSTPGGMSQLNNLLRSNGLITEPLDLAELAESDGSIPANASVVILARPQEQISPDEIAIVDDYLGRGGHLLILADMTFNEDHFLMENSAFSDYLWNNYGLRVLDAVIADPAASSQSELDVVSAVVYTNNAIGRNLNISGSPNTSTLFRIARPVALNPDSAVHNGSIITSSEQSWAERDLDAVAQQNQFIYEPDTDSAGPLTSAAWAYDERTGARIVIIGDGDFATNGHSQSPQGNAILFLDSVGWLTGFTEAVQFEPQVLTSGLPIMFIDGAALDAIALVTTVLMPGLMLIVAAVIWIWRRQALSR